MVSSSAATAAAQMGSLWMSRRVRVVAPTTTLSHQPAPQNQHILWQPAWLKPPAKAMYEPVSAITDSIATKVREKYASNQSQMEQALSELNGDHFWTNYGTLQDLAAIEKKDDIIRIINTFLFISKKSIYLFSNYSRKIIANRDFYSADELGEIANAFAQLGFLDESFCTQIANRVVADVANCSSNQIVNLMDAYATTRCYIEPVVDALCGSAGPMVNSFTPSQVSLFSSSLARLNVRNEPLFAKLSSRFVDAPDSRRTARDVTLTAYAFAKMKVPVEQPFQAALVQEAKNLIRDFTAKELQMLTTALDRWRISDPEIYEGISSQTQRRIGQFPADALVLLLRAFASRGLRDDSLVSRVVCQLPRLAQNMKSNETVGFITAFKELGTMSEVVTATLSPLVVTQAGLFNPSEWVAILSGVATIGSREMKQDTLDTFHMINDVPANYKASGTPVSKNIIKRFSDTQFVDSLNALVTISKEEGVKMDSTVSKFLSHLATERLVSMTPSVAGDTYCALVALGCHEDPQRAPIMQQVLARAMTQQ